MNPRIEREIDSVLDVVTHAQKVFGGDTPPTAPPQFASPRDLADDLGCGLFAR